MNAIDLKGEYDLPLFATSAVAFGLGAWLYRTRRQRLADYSFGIATATFVCGAVESVRKTQKQTVDETPLIDEAKFHALIQAEKQKRPEILQAIKSLNANDPNWAAPLLGEEDNFSNNRYIKSLMSSPDAWKAWDKLYEALNSFLPRKSARSVGGTLLTSTINNNLGTSKCHIKTSNLFGKNQAINFEFTKAYGERFSTQYPYLCHLQVGKETADEKIRALKAMFALLKFEQLSLLIPRSLKNDYYIGTFCLLNTGPDFPPNSLQEKLRPNPATPPQN